jgi:hypothetical protein
MNLILRMASSQSDSRCAEEARQLLTVTPEYCASLIQRIATSGGNKERAEAARELIETLPEKYVAPGSSSSLMRRIAARDGDRVCVRATVSGNPFTLHLDGPTPPRGLEIHLDRQN